jgi:hypothetical protein
MKRYFFDLVSEQTSQYDYRGRDLWDLESARHLAELMAIDLAVEPDGAWQGWSIRVSSALGQQFFSVPVQAQSIAA